MQSPATTRIHDSLDRALSRKRLVFWYDPKEEWLEEFESYPDTAVLKRRVEENEFALKVAIARAPLSQRFLLYIPSAKPEESGNWLLDLLLAGQEFKADRASLDLGDAGLPLEFKSLAREHSHFFRSTTRLQKFKDLRQPGDQEADIR
ncbi:MAG: BREX-1 system phosphatase PglZ type A, partial [Cyanobacteria bacterium]|nr:BREX-1 system phosphatase PglZ type A [Cyanobacteriota bacterium]